MGLPSFQNNFKMLIILCLCCVIAVGLLTVNNEYYGTKLHRPSSWFSASRIRLGIKETLKHNTTNLLPFTNRKYETNANSSNISSVTSANSTANDNNQNKGINEEHIATRVDEKDKSPGDHNVPEKSVLLSPCLNSKDIPDERITPRKERTTLEKVNDEVFGDIVQKIKDATDVANKTIPSILIKRKYIKEAASSIDQMIAEMNLAIDVDDYRLLPGGHWIPLSCQPLWKVAIVVPFRNRFQHLPIFLRHIVPLLKRQKLEFSIFISEQRNDLRFNRAMLMNVGFVEALNFTKFDCVVFHDIDHIAVNVKNYFGCENMPRHFISGEAIWSWKLPYATLFGGVTGVTTEQFYAINGLPNAYWGWGGEDDDFAARVTFKGLKRTRPEGEIGFFDSIEHQKKESSPQNSARFCLLKLYAERMSTDGISNLVYEPPTIELHPLYTNISVNIKRLPWNPKWKRCAE